MGRLSTPGDDGAGRSGAAPPTLLSGFGEQPVVSPLRGGDGFEALDVEQREGFPPLQIASSAPLTEKVIVVDRQQLPDLAALIAPFHQAQHDLRCLGESLLPAASVAGLSLCLSGCILWHRSCSSCWCVIALALSLSFLFRPPAIFFWRSSRMAGKQASPPRLQLTGSPAPGAGRCAAPTRCTWAASAAGPCVRRVMARILLAASATSHSCAAPPRSGRPGPR